jgi:CheY-like chemotaxis protein
MTLPDGVAETALPDGRPVLPEGPGRRFRQQPSVLVVDDDAAIRAVLRAGLERHGLQVWLAASGEEAIDLYRRHWQAIAVVLLDVRMPGLDGPETFDALRRLDPHVRACFMSGDPGDYEPEELLARGARQVFAKPFRVAELATALWLLGH